MVLRRRRRRRGGEGEKEGEREKGRGRRRNPLSRELETWGEGSGARGLSYGGQPMFQHQPVEGDGRRWDHVDLSTALFRL